MDPLIIAGRAFRSRLIVGTGKYRSGQETARAIAASGAEMVTVAVRRVNLDRNKESLLDFIDQQKYFLLPNTAGCYTADDAAIAMELGADAVLMNTGIAHAQAPVLMAEAMQHAVIAGRQAYVAGRMPKKLYATASSPLEGVVR